ncbi:MAG: hypothetical protein J2P18_01055 [Nocardia sp.]|nr:hypothetical protein [Nocardia sp.]
MELSEDRAGERVWELMERALLLVSPAPCPYAVAGELAMDQPRPPRIPPLLHNLHLHEGHNCPTEATLTRVCERRGYLKAVLPQSVPDNRR